MLPLNMHPVHKIYQFRWLQAESSVCNECYQEIIKESVKLRDVFRLQRNWKHASYGKSGIGEVISM